MLHNTQRVIAAISNLSFILSLAVNKKTQFTPDYPMAEDQYKSLTVVFHPINDLSNNTFCTTNIFLNLLVALYYVAYLPCKSL